MSGHSSEEKLKILYEDSLREIRELAGRMEAMSQSNAQAANLIVEVKNNLRAENERLLVGAAVEIKNAVAQVIGLQNNISNSASNTVCVLLWSFLLGGLVGGFVGGFVYSIVKWP